MVFQECTVCEKDRDGCPKIVNLGRCVCVRARAARVYPCVCACCV